MNPNGPVILVDSLDLVRTRLLDVIVAKIDLAFAHVELTGARREDSGQYLDQGRLAGAVVADEPDDFVATDLEIDIPQSTYQSEILLDVDHP